MDFRTARIMRRLSQWDVSIKTGVERTKLSLFENGYRVPSDHEKIILANSLGMEPSDIIWKKKTPNDISIKD
jgi:hypothetical protein